MRSGPISGPDVEPQRAGPSGDADLLRYEVLGPVRAVRGSEEVALGPAKQRTVLAVLLFAAGRAVSRDEIIQGVWGDAAPSGAPGLVANYVARLRKLLEPSRVTRSGQGPLFSEAAGYSLRIDRGRLDLWVFQDAVAAARALREAGRLAACADSFDDALTVWRGAGLDGLAGPFAETQRARLAELRLSAVEERFDVALELGRDRQSIPELSLLAGRHPHRERLRALLMLALYRAGRQADALAVFSDTWRALVRDLGIEPGPELRRLQERMLRRDPGLDRSPVVLDHPVPRQVPSDIPDFVGRRAELSRIRAVLCPRHEPPIPRVLTISGGAGVGKTALAVHAARLLGDRFPDGQLYADLHGAGPRARRPEDVLAGFLAELGAERIPDDADRREALYRTLTSGRRTLILLDDARDAAQIRSLIPNAGGCAVLVTSRGRLAAVPGNHLLELDVLGAEDAVRLLRAVVGAGPVAAEPEAVGDLVAACAGLPLALRIVGVRAAGHPGRPLRQLAERFRDPATRLHELRAGELAVRDILRAGYDGLLAGPDGVEVARACRLLGWFGTTDFDCGTAAVVLDRSPDRTAILLELLADRHWISELGADRFRLTELHALFGREVSQGTDTESGLRAGLGW